MLGFCPFRRSLKSTMSPTVSSIDIHLHVYALQIITKLQAIEHAMIVVVWQVLS